ncbi:MAG: type II secretion system protein GspD [Rhodothermaceae bacterium]
MKKSAILCLFFFIFISAQSDIKNKISNQPEYEFISISEEEPLHDVLNKIDLITSNQLSKRLNFSELKNNPVGISVSRIHYKKALQTLAGLFDFKINKTENSLVLNKITDKKKSCSDNPALEKQINISAILFEANIGDLKERGINWQAILSKHGLRIGSDFKSFKPDNDKNNFLPDFNLSVAAEGDIGPFSGYVNAVLKFLENEELGEIVSRLSVTVRNGQTGRMQVGDDISIKQLDFAGNVTDNFIPTGTIIEVTPKLGEHKSIDYALLDVHVERSVPYPGEITTSISKTASDTEVIMKDGEESIISGLLVTEERSIREGVPLLKDLPWWFLGLRYLFGYDKQVSLKKEAVILLKIEIVPPLTEREFDPSINLIREKIENDRKEIQKYKRLPTVEEKNEN